MTGPLPESVCDELNAMLTETRYMAICDALEAWQKDTNKPREGVLVLERMVKAGPVPQTFDWPHMDAPAHGFQQLLGRQSATSVASEARVPRRSNSYATPSKPATSESTARESALPVQQSAMMVALDAIDPERRQQLLEQTI